MEINQYIDATLISPKASIKDYITLAENAIKYNLRGVVVPTFALDYIKRILKGFKVITSTVIDFPLGLSDTYIRLKAIEYTINHHAKEIDLVINPVFIKASKYGSIEDELTAIHKYFRIPVKAIIDYGLIFSDSGTFEWELDKSCEIQNTIKNISSMVGVTHIKTGTGWFTDATVKLVKLYSSNSIKPIKAAGGIKSYQQALNLIASGASIIGTSSYMDIINEYSRNN